MKIKNEDYSILKDSILKAMRSLIYPTHYKKLISMKRYRWDLLHYSGLKIGDGVGIQGDLNLYAYLHDKHIDTALKHIMKGREESEIPKVSI